MSQDGRTRVNRWIRPEIQALSAYHVPAPGNMIKLDAMENPYPWPEELRQEWQQRLAETQVNRYPDPQAQGLKAALRDSMEIPDGAGLILGNGSDELIQMLSLALAGDGKSLLSVEPGFVMYRLIALFSGLEYVGVPLRQGDFSLDLAAMHSAIEQYQPALIFLAYPNNPTGNLFDASAIREIIQMAPGLVVIDEAYAPFTDHSFIQQVGDFNNLLVMRTLSKMGLAGLRLGYLTGSPVWLEQLEKVRLPYNINVLTQVSGEFALSHNGLFTRQAQQIRHQRSVLAEQLAQLPGIEVYPSEANFILFRTPPGEAAELYQGLQQKGVLVKNLHGTHDFLQECLRVTVGTADECGCFIKALQELLP